MAKATLICGTLCCGKTTYAERLREERGGVILSCDELMLSVFGQDAGERHDEWARGAQSYLFGLSEKIVDAGVSVILDWGFWTKASRESAREFFISRGIECELHYLDIDEKERRRRVDRRNGEVLAGTANAYYVDEGLEAKFLSRFEPPEMGEADVVITE